MEKLRLLLGGVGEDRLGVGIDEPPHLCVVVESVENFIDNGNCGSIGGENFNQPIRCEVKWVGDVAFCISRDTFPSEDTDVGNDNTISENAANFSVGTGDLLAFSRGVNGFGQVNLQSTVLSLGYWFLSNLPVLIFAGRLGFRALEKFLEREGFKGNLYHGQFGG